VTRRLGKENVGMGAFSKAWQGWLKARDAHKKAKGAKNKAKAQVKWQAAFDTLVTASARPKKDWDKDDNIAWVAMEIIEKFL
jgi:hypothetical protein